MSGKPGPGKLPMRLPPVYQLRVRRNTSVANEECNKIMSTVLSRSLQFSRHEKSH